MTSPTTHRCPEGITDEQLSDWRANGVTGAESERLVRHVATCAVCQQILLSFDRIALLLRREQVPEPDTALWQTLERRMQGVPRRGVSTRLVRRSRRPAVLGSLAAVAAVVVLMIGYAAVLHTQPAHPVTTSRPTVTATPAAPRNPVVTLPAPPTVAVPTTAANPLRWQGVSTPFTQTTMDAVGIGVAASDATSAYLCDARAQVQMWVTHDRGTTWTQARALPLKTVLGIAQCSVTVDARHPNTVAVSVSVQDQSYQVQRLTYLSTDAGASWRLVPSVVTLDDLVTEAMASYALVSTGSSDTTSSAPRLMISTDMWNTWHPVDTPITAGNTMVFQFWAESHGSTSHPGRLLAEVGPVPQGVTSADPVKTLWQTEDGGVHWERVPAPAMTTFVATPNRDGSGFVLCASGLDPQAATTGTADLACSTTGGQSWMVRPSLSLQTACTESACATPVAHQTGTDFSVLPDGTILAEGPYGPVQDGVIQHITGMAVYQLRPSTSRWESLGPAPGNALFVVSGAQTATTWDFAGGAATGNTLSGTVGQTSQGQAIAVATLP